MRMVLPTQGICKQIRLARMVVDLQVIVLDELQPTTLPKVEIFLGKYILQTLMVGIDLALGPYYIMSPNLECMHYGRQF
jgi:hypothetical protein